MRKVVLQEMGLDSLLDYENADYADFWAGKYMEIYNVQEQDAVKRLLRPSSGWFLDAGCGCGRFSSVYRELYPKKVMVDYVINSLEKCRENNNDNHSVYVAADVCALPFRNNIFNATVNIRMIQNMPDPDTILGSLSRVMRPASQLVMSFFNRRNLLRSLKYGSAMDEVGHIRDIKASYSDMYGTHPHLFNQLARKHHLKKNKVIGTGFSYQLSRNNRYLQGLIESNASFRTAYKTFGHGMDMLLGAFSLSLWQFVDLVKHADNDVADSHTDDLDFASILQCPACAGQSLLTGNSGVRCMGCNREYPKINGIYDFRIFSD